MDEAIEILEDVNLGGLARPHQLLGQAHDFQNNIAHALLVIGGGAKAVDIEVLEGKPRGPRLPFLGVACLEIEQRFRKSSRAEVGRMRIQHRVLLCFKWVLLVDALLRLGRQTAGQVQDLVVSLLLFRLFVCLDAHHYVRVRTTSSSLGSHDCRGAGDVSKWNSTSN